MIENFEFDDDSILEHLLEFDETQRSNARDFSREMAVAFLAAGFIQALVAPDTAMSGGRALWSSFMGVISLFISFKIPK